MTESLSTLAGKVYSVVFENSLVTVLTMEVGGVNEIPEKWPRILTESEQFVIRPDLDVYFGRNENCLVYVKKGCQPAAGLSAQFHPVPAELLIFLHVISADVDALPDDRKRYGFEDLDFYFNDHRLDIRLGERCISVRDLPAYAVVGIRTGEYTDEGRLWEAEVSFSE